MKTKLVSKRPCLFKKLVSGQSPKKKEEVSILTVNIICALFSLLSTRDDLVMQVLVWLCMVWFGASYVNLR
jgi:hypothetical protein